MAVNGNSFHQYATASPEQKEYAMDSRRLKLISDMRRIWVLKVGIVDPGFG